MTVNIESANGPCMLITAVPDARTRVSMARRSWDFVQALVTYLGGCVEKKLYFFFKRGAVVNNRYVGVTEPRATNLVWHAPPRRIVGNIGNTVFF